LFSVTLISSTPRFNTFTCEVDVELWCDVVLEFVAFCGLLCVLLALFVCVSVMLVKRMTRSCTWNVAPAALLPFGTAAAAPLAAAGAELTVLRLVCGDEGCASGVTTAILRVDDPLAALVTSRVDASLAGAAAALVEIAEGGVAAHGAS
jgi:hypothetical protein